MNFKDISILFVEDDPHIQKEISTFLKEQIFSAVYTASNGSEGLQQYYEYKPDIILTDLNMPKMNGLAMSEIIKDHHPRVPILLITSDYKKEVTERCVDIGIDGYLFKPISLLRLKKVLESYCMRVLLQKNFDEKHKLLHEYKNAIDVSSAVSKTNANGMITYVNDAFCEASGYKKEELLGKNHNIIRHPDVDDSFFQQMWQTITNKQVWQGNVKNRKKSGASFVAKTSIVPILDNNNQILEYIAIRQDITDLYEQETYLKRRVDEEVKKNLNEVKFSSIGKMAAGITHEINTPLTYIKGNLELMLQDINSLDPSLKVKEYLIEDANTILSGVDRIASIVESMREVASQRSDVFMHHNLYSSLITALTISYNKAKLITPIVVQNEPFMIGMDKKKYTFIANYQIQRLEQVFIIIINNALDVLKLIEDFDQRKLEISIVENTNSFSIVFQDNGGGIAPEVLLDIFDPFQSTKEEGGMGIGLNVAQKIVHDHNGSLLGFNYKDGAHFEVVIPKEQTPDA